MKKEVHAGAKSKGSEKSNLRYELDFRNRELFVKTMLISEKNNVLNKIKEELSTLKAHASEEGTNKIRQMIHTIDQSINQDERLKSFIVSFERIHPQFFEKLSLEYPALSQNELKHCAYIRMNLSNKEVANMLHISPKSVEMARYRIKKKLDLNARGSLIQFLNKF